VHFPSRGREPAAATLIRKGCSRATAEIPLHLDWHRRELKSEWWEFYRLGELSERKVPFRPLARWIRCDAVWQPLEVAELRHTG
jgi:hypothetical protein